MPYITNKDEVRFYYEDYQPDKQITDNTPVVFLHGFTLDSRMWHQQVEYFKQNYRVILIDARGHGQSDAPPTNYSRDDRVEDVMAVLDALEIKKIHLVGLSMGGTTAIGLALKYQSMLKTLTLVSTGAAGYSVGKRIGKINQIAREKGVDAARERWMKGSLVYYKDDRAELREQLSTMMREHSGAIWMDPMRGKHPRTIDLDFVHKIKVPTVLFVGEVDTIFEKLARLLHEKIPHSKLIVYPGTGHMLNMEIPDHFNVDLDVFLKSNHRFGGC